MSCMSRAGCCCGTNMASKFQKPDSTKLWVGISAKPIWKKMPRSSSRTFSKGWREPPFVGIPSASKLYFLKEFVFQDPLFVVLVNEQNSCG